MHDIAPARLATDDDVWTSDGVVLPWQPSTATDEVILVSVTGSDTALEEFPSELDEFPSERDGRLHASPAEGVAFVSEAEPRRSFCARETVDCARETVESGARHRSHSQGHHARSAGSNCPGRDAGSLEVSSRAVRSAPPLKAVVLVDTPIATDAGTQRTSSSSAHSHLGALEATDVSSPPALRQRC